ncbi:MAG: hypothetical protein AUH84_06650 [Thaumarchaeota archaeon 13_1_40CM_4_38_7]|nr:MAG: hypothetical protein AUH84_06650 [Thaumarchaeota archaeon 13_1_40CM_4_38_7]OLC93761.1 MAG: hypothetical protein AUI92_02135 [Thaumarchaeota archaeon 13_1_40CM_3_38_6]
MTEDFSKFQDALLELIKSFEQKNVIVKTNSEPDSNIIRIYGEGSDALALAKAGLEEAAELAYATAEHHPYWNLLYSGTQILKIVLDKWNQELTAEELKEISWHADEIKNSTKNLVTKNE